MKGGKGDWVGFRQAGVATQEVRGERREVRGGEVGRWPFDRFRAGWANGLSGGLGGGHRRFLLRLLLRLLLRRGYGGLKKATED
jgi:hypothetical protein